MRGSIAGNEYPITQEYKWAAVTGIFLTQSFTRSLANAAEAQLAPMSTICANELASQLRALNMAILIPELMPSLESKRQEVLVEIRIELDRAFAERRRGFIRNIALGVGNLIGKMGGK